MLHLRDSKTTFPVQLMPEKAMYTEVCDISVNPAIPQRWKHSNRWSGEFCIHLNHYTTIRLIMLNIGLDLNALAL